MLSVLSSSIECITEILMFANKEELCRNGMIVVWCGMKHNMAIYPALHCHTTCFGVRILLSMTSEPIC